MVGEKLYGQAVGLGKFVFGRLRVKSHRAVLKSENGNVGWLWKKCGWYVIWYCVWAVMLDKMFSFSDHSGNRKSCSQILHWCMIIINCQLLIRPYHMGTPARLHSRSSTEKPRRVKWGPMLPVSALTTVWGHFLINFFLTHSHLDA